MMPELTADGLLVAGDAAALCLAAGIWLEGVNFAMASGMYAGEAAVEALARRRHLGRRPRRLRAPPRRRRSCCATTASCAGRPSSCCRDRVQHLYPQLVADVVERMFRVDNPLPKPGLRRIARARSASAPASAAATWPATRSTARSFG